MTRLQQESTRPLWMVMLGLLGLLLFLGTFFLLNQRRTSTASVNSDAVHLQSRDQAQTEPPAQQLSAPAIREPVEAREKPVSTLPTTSVDGQGSRQEEAIVGQPNAIPGFETRLELALDTFLTDYPDVEGLVDLLHKAADTAEIDADSEIIRVKGTDLSLTIAKDSRGVGFQLRRDFEEGEFFFQETSLRFANDNKDPGYKILVQSYPRTDRPPEEYLAPGEERCIGWSVSCGPQGSELLPLTMSIAGPGEWKIGHAETYERKESAFVANGSLREKWLSLLAERNK